MFVKWLGALVFLLASLGAIAEDLTPSIDQNSSARQFLELADQHLTRNELFEARANYNKALALDPTLDKAYLGRGIARGRMRELDAALDDLNYYIKRHPDSSYAYTKRGVNYIWVNDFESAYKDLLKAIELDPTNAEALDDLGVIYARRNEIEKSMQSFRAAIKHEPIYQKAYHNLALMHYAVEEYDQAYRLINQALELQPSDVNALLLKASILDALGKHSEAAAIKEEAEFLPQDLDWRERLPVK